MGTLGWTVVGSVAGVVCAVATVVFGVIPFLRSHREVARPEISSELVPAVASGEGPVVIGDIPGEPLGFQPRTDLLAVLDAPREGSRIVLVHAVTGMRGVGKTQLAAAYARRRLAEHWRLVGWVHAEDPGLLLAGLAVVAAAWGLEAADAEAAGRAIRHRLETDGERCLLVFDNVTDPELVQPFLPVSGESRVILTSNRQSVAHLGVGVPVEVFTERQAVAYLAGRTGRKDDYGARLVAEELGWLPLALAQAAALIADQHLDYDTYLDRLRGLQVSELLVPVEAGQYPRGAAPAVLLSLDGARAGEDGAACGSVMNLLAVLSTAGVRRSLIHAAGRAGLPGRDGQVFAIAPDVADRVLAQLSGASLLTFSVDGSAVASHRLVMRVIRENLAASGSLTGVCQAAADLLDGLVVSLRQTWHKDRRAARDLTEQIMALAESCTECPAESDLDRHMMALRWCALWFLIELADSPAQAIMIGDRLLADQEQALGPDDYSTLATRNSLVIAYREAGRTAGAITMQEQTLAAMERTSGPDHPDTLSARGNLAVTYQQAGRMADAITLYEQTLADEERALGPDHPSTLKSRINLAAAYRVAGRTAEAITMQEQTLTARERVLGPDHPDTLGSRGNLAIAYQDAGRTAEAITVQEQTLTAMERVMGPDHPSTLKSRNNLADAYRVAGRTAEAITMQEQTLTAMERILGPDHPDTLGSRGTLADAYRDAGRTGGAKDAHL